LHEKDEVSHPTLKEVETVKSNAQKIRGKIPVRRTKMTSREKGSGLTNQKYLPPSRPRGGGPVCR